MNKLRRSIRMIKVRPVIRLTNRFVLIALLAFVPVLSLIAPAAAATVQSGWWEGSPNLNQPFGCTGNPNEPARGGCPHFHGGIDLDLPCNANLRAPVNLTLARISTEAGYGNTSPIVRLPDGHEVLLAHTRNLRYTAAGSSIPSGEIIAQVGGDPARPEEGNSTGCHLHFEVRPAGGDYVSSIDPMPFLNPTTKPGGWWQGPTPTNGSRIFPNGTIQLGAHIEDNGNGGISRALMTVYNPGAGQAWHSVNAQTIYTTSPPRLDITSSYYVPYGTTELYVSFDVYSNNGSFQRAPHGVRKFCTYTPCDTSNTNSVGGYGVGGGGGSSGGSATACTPGQFEAALFADKNYDGQCVVKSLGDYNNPEAIGLPNDTIESVRVGSGSNVWLCDNANINNPCEWFNHDDSDLSNNSINVNTVSSVRIIGDQPTTGCSPSSTQVAFFTDKDYGGSCVIKGIGTYNNPEDIGLPNDSISSIKAGNKVKVRACNNAGNNSPCEYFDYDDPDLSNNSLNTDTISSAMVESRGDALLCTDTNYGGTCKAFGEGTVADLNQYGLSGNVSSLQISGPWTVFLNDNINQTGQPGVYTTSMPDLGGQYGWNDRARSLKIEPLNDTSCTVDPSDPATNGIMLYRDGNFETRGGCKLITGDISDLRPSTFDGFSGLRFLGQYKYNYKVSVYREANYNNLCGSYWLDQPWMLNPVCTQAAVSLKVEPFTVPQQARNIAPAALRDSDNTQAVVDDSLDTQWVGGHKKPLGLVFQQPETVQSVVIFDRAQAQDDNNQINKSKLVFSDGTIIDNIDMISGGPRCAEVKIPAKAYSWINVVPVDASGNNGFREIQVWDASGEAFSNVNCVNKTVMTPVLGTGPAPTASWPEPPVPPEPVSGYQAQYFNNTTLSGSPVLTRSEQSIAHDWGGGSPDALVNVDNFSARWTKAMNFAAGDYAFTVTADDGLRLYIDGQIVIDKWIDQPSTTYTATRHLAAGNHTVAMEYYENGGGAVAELGFGPAQEPVEPTQSQADFVAEYFANKTLSGSPVLTRNDAAIGFDWGGGSPGAGIPVDNFSVRWTKTAQFAAGNYRFTATGDDGLRLYVDDQAVINGWVDQPPTTYTTDLGLTAGTHTIRFEYFESGGGAVAGMRYALAADPNPNPNPGATTGTELLSSPWHIAGNDGASELYQSIGSNALAGKTTMRVTYDLHGLNALGSDASAIIFDQNGWNYVSLSDYGQNGLNGEQTVDIPLSAFGLDLSQGVGTLHTRFWHEGAFGVDVRSIVVY